MNETKDDTTVAGSDERTPGSASRKPYLIVISGPRFGDAVPVTKENVLVGRDPVSQLSLEQEDISFHHAKVIVLPRDIYMVKDLGSTNGTFVNEEKIDNFPLEHGDVIRIGLSTRLRFSLEDTIESRLREHLVSQATSDPLTGLKNKQGFTDELQRAFAFSRRHGEALSLILFDADHFKLINDQYGHNIGDAVLRELGARIKSIIRSEDYLSRIGGEEFALILRGIDKFGAVQVAERVRRVIADQAISADEQLISLTISVGCATFNALAHDTPEALLLEADERLYAAKAAGRNQVNPSS